MAKRKGGKLYSGRNKKSGGMYLGPGFSGRDYLVNAGINAVAGGNPVVRAGAKFAYRLAKQQANKNSMLKYRTQAKRAKRRMAKSPQDGKSGGFFDKKAKADQFAMYTKNGVVSTREVGILCRGQQPSRPVIIGHATHANYYDIVTLFFRGLVREIFNKGGVQILDMETDSPGSYNMFITYVNGDSTAGESTYSQACSGLSYIGVANALRTNFLPIVGSISGLKQFYIESVDLRIGTERIAKLDYRDSYVNIKAKSSLKIQNRTVAAGTDEDANSTENVANQPVYGKCYEGKGNGLLTRVDSQAASIGKSLNCSEFGSNVIAYAPGTFDYWLDEPPLPSLFTPYPKCSSARIEPGYIRTSVLVDTWICKQTDFWKVLNVSDGALQNYAVNLQNRYGKFAIFALEKMICVSASDTAPSLGAECNTRLGLMFQHKQKKVCAEVTEGQTFVTEINGPNAPP